MDKRDKKNIQSFNKDALQGSYAYYGNRLSSRLANARIDAEITTILTSFPITGKTVLDIGSGDGTTAILLCELGAKRIVGIDPAENAVATATRRCEKLAATRGKTVFYCDDINTLDCDERFDLAVFSRVIHHLPDPGHALRQSARFAATVLIVEPNGWNPVLKLIEKMSPYHRGHDEKSYTSFTLKKWCKDAGYEIQKSSYVNLVPMFCPDWMAALCRTCEPFVERLPFVSALCCGQILLYATR